jgi:signal peptidase I
MKRRAKVSLGLLVAIVLLALTVRFVVTPYVVVGDSMLPTLHSWELCLMARTPRYEPERGDIVMFRTADAPVLHFVKRVVALPGETVAIEAGVAMVDTKPLDEPYTTRNLSWDMPATIVPAEKVFVLGDNRDVPLDATVHGIVATRLVEARLLGHWRWRQ